MSKGHMRKKNVKTQIINFHGSFWPEFCGGLVLWYPPEKKLGIRHKNKICVSNKVISYVYKIEKTRPKQKQ